MPRAKKKKNRLSGLLSNKRFHIVVVALLFGAVGAYLVFGVRAATPNPPLARSCGLDVALLVDTSGSMKGEPREQAFNAMRNFVTTMNGTDTRFAIGEITAPASTTWTTDTAVALRHIDQLGSSTSELNDVSGMYEHDPRPDHPNLIIVLSDFHIAIEDSNVDETKRDGTRILSLMYHPPHKPISTYGVASYVSGPNIDTGSVLTSDVITAKTDTVGGEFLGFAYQLCGVGPGGAGHGPGHGHGDGGTGTGTNGQGAGTGPGPGAAGGGGSSATTQGDAANATPSNTDQGEAPEQPKVEPSPFFDGKLFGIGSDSDPNTQKDDKTVSVGGWRIGYGWLGVLGLLVLLGIIGFIGWLYRKRLRKVFTSLRK